MSNPWEKISLSDYENHMKLASVMQLQAMNEMMKVQFDDYPVSCVMILGIAGGNGLEHVQKNRFEKIYGVDINDAYLQEVVRRYPELDGTLECLHVNLIEEHDTLPKADMVIANLLIEYIGYDCFQEVIRHVDPRIVSCIIQINLEDSWVSDSPYLHVFDGLEEVHHQMEEQELERAMMKIGYHSIKTSEHLLPNGKKLVRIDFEKKEDIHDHGHIHGHGHPHRHVHSEEEKRAVINRLSRVIGHLESVKRMVERGEENDIEAIEKLNQAIDKFMK